MNELTIDTIKSRTKLERLSKEELIDFIIANYEYVNWGKLGYDSWKKYNGE